MIRFSRGFNQKQPAQWEKIILEPASHLTHFPPAFFKQFPMNPTLPLGPTPNQTNHKPTEPVEQLGSKK